MNKRITTQEIADSLGISRNTVSKALNNNPNLSKKMKTKILIKAKELGYIHPTVEQDIDFIGENKEIAFLTQNIPYGSHFGTVALEAFHEKISNHRFKLSIYLIREEDIKNKKLPLGFDSNVISGILCMELFDKEYIEFLSSLGIPILFIDHAYNINPYELEADFILMENFHSTKTLTETLIKDGLSRLAFAGHITHCNSFWERYQGFKSALDEAGLKEHTRDFIKDNVFADKNKLFETIKKQKELPEIFITANDDTATDLIKALRKNNIKVSKDILITGFDNAIEAKIFDPPLTSINIPSASIGARAADMLLNRIKDPKMPHLYQYVNTTIIYRDSSKLTLLKK